MDADGTLDDVQQRGHFRVGLIASDADHEARSHQRIGAIAGTLGFRADIVEGSSEGLLLGLEEGALDLVVGPLSDPSPWQARVHVLPSARGGPQVTVRVAARNGENAWIGRIHTAVADLDQR